MKPRCAVLSLIGSAVDDWFRPVVTITCFPSGWDDEGFAVLTSLRFGGRDVRCAPDAGWGNYWGNEGILDVQREQRRERDGTDPPDCYQSRNTANLVGAEEYRSHSHLATDDHDGNPFLPGRSRFCRRGCVDETGCAPDAGWKTVWGNNTRWNSTKSKDGSNPAMFKYVRLSGRRFKVRSHSHLAAGIRDIVPPSLVATCSR